LYAYLQEYLRGLIDKLDAQIKRSRERLLADQSGRLTLSKETQAQVDEMANQIKELQDEANQLGEAGEVDESMKKMTEVEAIKVKKDALENPTFPGKEKIMEVCDTCCNFMANTDSDVRKNEHLAGKQLFVSTSQ
jgi:RNA-binding protein Luc7-like 2